MGLSPSRVQAVLSLLWEKVNTAAVASTNVSKIEVETIQERFSSTDSSVFGDW